MNVRIDLGQLTRSVFNRVKQDSAGQQVRDLLGSSANSVIHARALPRKRDDLTVPVPLLAMRRGGLTIVEDAIHAVTFRWWIYDNSDEDYFYIERIVKPLATAYDPEVSPLLYPNGERVGYVEVGAGDQAEDPVLGMPYVIVPVVVYC